MNYLKFIIQKNDENEKNISIFGKKQLQRDYKVNDSDFKEEVKHLDANEDQTINKNLKEVEKLCRKANYKKTLSDINYKKFKNF